MTAAAGEKRGVDMLCVDIAYVAWHAEAGRRYRKGERQGRCPDCLKWYFPNWPADVTRHQARCGASK